METPVTAEFERRLRAGADAGKIAREAQRSWDTVVASLSPVLGVRGVASLAQRCVRLASARYPWLSDASVAKADTKPGSSLADVLSRRTPAEAASAAALLLTTLDELLTSLVGASLTKRLLAPVWSDLLRDTNTQGEIQ